MKPTAHLTRQQQNDRANALNKNRGTSGTNITNAHVHGNRGKQLSQRSTQAIAPAVKAAKGRGK